MQDTITEAVIAGLLLISGGAFLFTGDWQGPTFSSAALAGLEPYVFGGLLCSAALSIVAYWYRQWGTLSQETCRVADA